MKSQQLKAIGWMVLACAATSLVYVQMRMIGEQLSAYFIVMVSEWMATALIGAWMLWQKRPLKTTRWKMYGLRGLAGYASYVTALMAVMHAPLGQVTALAFTAPIFTSLLAVMFWGERLMGVRALCLAGGFAGVLVVARPWEGAVGLGTWLILASAFCWAMVNMTIKSLSKTDDTPTMLFFSLLAISILSAPMGLAHAALPTIAELGWLFAMAATSLLYVLAVYRAYAGAPLTLVMPFEFTALIFSTLFGALLFDEALELHTYAGAAIIVLASLYLLRRETRAG